MLAPPVAAISRARGERRSLPTRALIGRSRRCDLVLTDPSVSGEHAVIWWDGKDWWIRDLGSRNGTWVDDARLGLHESLRLSQGGQLRFGDTPRAWTVDSIDAPRPRAVLVDEGREAEGEDGILALPNEEEAVLAIYGDPRSGWVLESEREVRAVADLEELEVAGQRWRLHLPQLLEPTQMAADEALRLAEISLCFEVSSDEEHVSLVAASSSSPARVDLGSRAHHYMLLTLARARLADSELAEPARGWVYQDELYAGLGVDREQLNMAVFRARKQLAKAGIRDARRLVERRVDSQQLRLGVAEIQIQRA
jgi:hypothetical protein